MIGAALMLHAVTAAAVAAVASPAEIPGKHALQPSLEQQLLHELSLCTLFTLEYEAPYLLPFVAYHTLVGFDHFFLYHDDLHSASRVENASSAQDPSADHASGEHAALLTALYSSPSVTLLSMRSLGLTNQSQQIAHCSAFAAKTSKWIGVWDVDEVPAVAPTALLNAAAPDQGQQTPAPSVRAFLQALPSWRNGLILPRQTMDTHPLADLPSAGGRLEYEVYARPL